MKDKSKSSANSKNLLTYGLGAIAGYYGLTFVARKIIDITFSRSLKVFLTDKYDESLMELFSVTKKVGPQNIVENNLRTTEGKLLDRPMGSPRDFPNFNQLMFNNCQLYNMPTELETMVDTKVTIGKTAKKPVTISMPILITGMAYGEALSEKAKVALAKGAALAGTGSNTGEGPFLPAERKAAKILTLQYNRGYWNKTPEILKQANMIEIQLGQGALAGVGHIVPAKSLDLKLKAQFGILPGKDLITPSRQPEVQKPEDLVVLVQKLRTITGGVPIGVKVVAGKYLEKDLEYIVNAQVDFIAVEAAEAATKGSAPILQDDFGIPAIFAFDRAANFLRKHNLKNKISLLVAGGLKNPGNFLKALALGADACYIGSLALFAIGHEQILKPLPFEPPTDVVWYDGKSADQFDPKLGAKNLDKFLRSCNEEIIYGIRALGKTSVSQVNKDDLVALDESIAKALNIPTVYDVSE